MLGLHFGRKQVQQSRRDLVRAEFEEGMEHIRQAAMHMAGGVNAGLGPGLGNARQMARDRTMQARGMMNNPRMMAAAGRARDAASRGRDMSMSAFGPIADAARTGMMTRHMDADDEGTNGAMSRLMFASSRRAAAEEPEGGHSNMYAMLAGGAVLGAAGALVARRRTRTKWAEYEPDTISEDAEAFVGTGATSSKDFSRRDNTMSKAKDRARGAYENVRTRRQEHGHHHEGEGHTHQSGGPGAGPMADDEVDRLIRSAKNGRM